MSNETKRFFSKLKMTKYTHFGINSPNEGKNLNVSQSNFLYNCGLKFYDYKTLQYIVNDIHGLIENTIYAIYWGQCPICTAIS